MIAMISNRLLSRIDLQEARRITVESLMTHRTPGSLISAEHADEIGADLEEYDPGRGDAVDPLFAAFVRLRADELLSIDAVALDAVIDSDGMVEIHRAMVVPRRWLDVSPDTRKLGLCWAWSEDCAVSHHGAGGIDDPVEIRMRGRVHMDDVDWTVSLALNAGDDYVTGTENEIRLKEGAGVELNRIEWRQDIFDAYEPHEDFANTPVSI